MRSMRHWSPQRMQRLDKVEGINWKMSEGLNGLVTYLYFRQPEHKYKLFCAHFTFLIAFDTLEKIKIILLIH